MKANRRCGEMAPLSEVRGRSEGRRRGCDVVLLAQPSVALGQVAHGAEGAPQRARGPLGLADERRHGRADELGFGGDRVGSPRPRWTGRHARHGSEVEERRHHLDSRSAVEQGVVDLGDHGDVPGLEPLDHVHLPQRAVRGRVAGRPGRPRMRPARRARPAPGRLARRRW